MAAALDGPDANRIRRLIQTSRTPLVFRGLIASWPMLSYRPSDWAKLFGDRKLDCRVGVVKSTSHEPQWEGDCGSIECTYSELVNWYNKSGGVEQVPMKGLKPEKHFLYFGYKYMKDIFSDQVLRETDWAAFGYPERNGNESTFWLGTTGAHTPCHYDTYGCNLVAQVSGRKRWILYPPGDGRFMKPSRVPYEESSVYSRVNFEPFDDESAPPIGGTHPHVVVLEPGDVLFVPRHWWHFVTNLELSVSVNTWLERPEDEAARLQEGLVKFFMAHVSRNLSNELLPQLLNPNEEETVDTDLDELQRIIQHSLRLTGQQRTTETSPAEVPVCEPWITVVTASPVVQLDALQQTAPAGTSVDVLDVIRAFCHPRVIATVADILTEGSNQPT